MSEKELLQHYKTQQKKALYYFQRYIEELKFHFGLNNSHIIKIIEIQLRILKSENRRFNLFKFFRQR